MKRISSTICHLSFSAALLLLIGVAFYMMCASNPLRWDDLMYQYVWLDHRVPELLHPIDLDNRVDNIGEAFLSQCHHYEVMNGRFIVHFITQCFCGFLGKGLFNVVNALIYVLFLLLGLHFTRCQFSTPNSRLSPLNSQLSTLNSQFSILIVVAGLWLLLPVQWILSFDVVFPINYLWSATACLAFILLFRNDELRMKNEELKNEELKKKKWWKNALLLLFGIFCGSFHEGYSLLVSGALFFYALTHLKKLSASQWCLIVGMWIGTLTVIGSPGIWNRASGASAASWQEALERKLDILRYSKRLYLLVIAMAAGWLLLGRKRMRQFVVENQIELMIVAFGFAFLFMLPYYSQRMGFPMELFSVLLMLKLFLAAIHSSPTVSNRVKPWPSSVSNRVKPWPSSVSNRVKPWLSSVSNRVKPWPSSVSNRVKPWLVVLLAVLLAVHVVVTVGYARKVGAEYEAMMAEYQASPDGVAHRQAFEVPGLFRPYIYRLGEPSEVGMISFTMKKELRVE